jgi:hypothetical protein
MSRKAIPTVYNGIEFRSRLEAKWAAMFDLIGWRWEYEPIDLAGYIPDFIIGFESAPMLCEIKPATTIDELRLAVPKIERSGWEGEALVLGSMLDNTPFSCLGIGLLSAKCDYGEWAWDIAVSHFCRSCQRNSVHHFCGKWHCRRCDAYDGDRYLATNEESMQAAWAQATNITKYRHGR